jgi:hypothetical protein
MNCRSWLLLVSLVSATICCATGSTAATTASIKKDRPAKPEENGLRLELNAVLEDRMTSSGGDFSWGGAFLKVEIALTNISPTPLTVPTTSFEPFPEKLQPSGEGLQKISLIVDSPKFRNQPTAFVAARYSPVVLAPGETVMLMNHQANISDRKQADAFNEVLVYFSVLRNFNGPKEWWRGHLDAYVKILRRIDPDAYIEKMKASQKAYAAQKEAEKDPSYGKTNAARVAALIASADQAEIRGEIEKAGDKVVVRDPSWIRQVGEAVAAASLSRTVSCLCIGWRTAYFYKDGQMVLRLAAIHGNQLRVFWTGGGGDYPIAEDQWQAVKAALEYHVAAPAAPEPPPGLQP